MGLSLPITNYLKIQSLKIKAMEKKWNWQKARMEIKPGENRYIDKLAKQFKKVEEKFGFIKTQKALKILFYLILCYLMGDLMFNLMALF